MPNVVYCFKQEVHRMQYKGNVVKGNEAVVKCIIKCYVTFQVSSKYHPIHTPSPALKKLFSEISYMYTNNSVDINFTYRYGITMRDTPSGKSNCIFMTRATSFFSNLVLKWDFRRNLCET